MASVPHRHVKTYLTAYYPPVEGIVSDNVLGEQLFEHSKDIGGVKSNGK